MSEFQSDAARDAIEAARNAEQVRQAAELEKWIRDSQVRQERSLLGANEMSLELSKMVASTLQMARESGFPLAGMTVYDYVDSRLAVMRLSNGGRIEDIFHRPYQLRGLNERAAGLREDGWAGMLGATTRLYWPFHDLFLFTLLEGFTPTANTGGSHTPGGYHPPNRAQDVRTKGKSNREVAQFMDRARWLGIFVLDERKPIKASPHWKGAHLHLDSRYYDAKPIENRSSLHWAGDSVRQRSGDYAPVRSSPFDAFDLFLK